MAANEHLSAEQRGDEGAPQPLSAPMDSNGDHPSDGTAVPEGQDTAPDAGLAPEALEAAPPSGSETGPEEGSLDEASSEERPDEAEKDAVASEGELEAGGADAEAAVSDERAQEEGAQGAETTLPEPPRKKHHVAPALVALDRVLDDETFRIRPEGDLSLLATDIARLGQLFPVDLRLVPPSGFQVISGFRRVAALRFLQRDKVLARLHTDLDDDDALLMALAAAIHSVPVGTEQLTELKARLEQEGRLSAAARDMLEKALTQGEALAPEGPMVEIDADELAVDVTRRLGAINQDLALLADVFGSLDESQRAELLDQLRYSSELVAFLEGQG